MYKVLITLGLLATTACLQTEKDPSMEPKQIYEDQAFSEYDVVTGYPAFGVRRDRGAMIVGSDGDWNVLSLDDKGNVWATINPEQFEELLAVCRKH